MRPCQGQAPGAAPKGKGVCDAFLRTFGAFSFTDIEAWLKKAARRACYAPADLDGDGRVSVREFTLASNSSHTPALKSG